MPEACDICDLYDVCPKRDIYNEYYKSKDCPLRSTDDMIAEIKNDAFSTFGNTRILSYQRVMDIIRKYTKEQNNE